METAMRADLLIDNIGQLATLAGPPGPRRGAAMRDLALVEGGAVAAVDGRILAAGPREEVRARFTAAETLDAGGRAVVPGFVDPHTHLPWAGDRAAEFEMRVAGATYMEIMAAGGGIVRTVEATRRASPQELAAQTAARLDRMLAHGTTTAEAKTGYGLETAAELKQLFVIAALQDAHPIDLVPTFMGAHAVPEEYRGRTDAYVALVIEEMLPAAAAAWESLRRSFEPGWPVFCDVFCERGAFDLMQSERVLAAAQALGFGRKIHVDEFAPLGGTPLAVRLGAISADHLLSTPEDHVQALAASDTVAVSLPGTPFGLGQHHFTPARALIDAGGALALATDLNPGTSWCESMQFIIALACRYLRLTPAEALCASTVNAAHALGLGDRCGSLEPGKWADLVILEEADIRMLGYRFGTNLARGVVKRGRLVVGA
jgi:imidazolonepropionase